MRLDDWVLCRIYKKSNTLQSSEPTRLPDMKDSGVEDNTSQNNIQPVQELKLQKSLSISDFFDDYNALAQLFDNPFDLYQPAGTESGSFTGDPIVKQQEFIVVINYGQFPASTATATDNYLKRQRSSVDDANNGFLHLSKKRSVVDSCNFTGHGKPV